MFIFANSLTIKRSPTSTALWITVILLLPILGALLYLIFGTRKSTHRLSHRKLDLILTRRNELSEEEANPVDRMIRQFNLPGSTIGNTLNLKPTGEECFQALMDLIESAERFIHIQTFLLHLDDVGNIVFKRLCERAREGIEIRLMVDSLGTLPTRHHHLKPLESAGGKVCMFDPILHGRGRTNLRNHRKIAIADAKIVFAGGTNIASEYIGPTPRKDRWRDMSFLLQGPATGHYCDIFRSDWEYGTSENLDNSYVIPEGGFDATGEHVAQVVPSGPDIHHDILYDAILQFIFQAKTRVRCVTPYFIPDSALLQALILTSKRGVDVEIITPRKSNHAVANIARESFLRQLEHEGANIFYYEPGMVHGKVMVIDDDAAMIGSTNLDQRSLFLNYEASVIVWNQQVIKETDSWIDSLKHESTTGTPEPGRGRAIIEGLSQVLAPLL